MWSVGVVGDAVFEETRVTGSFSAVERFKRACDAWRDAVHRTPASNVLARLPSWESRESLDWTDVLRDVIDEGGPARVAAWMIRRLRRDLVRLSDGPGSFFVLAVGADRLDLAQLLVDECGAGSFRRDAAHESVLWAIYSGDWTKLERVVEMFGRERDLCYRAANYVVRGRPRNDGWMRDRFGMAYDPDSDRVVVVPNGRAASPVHTVGELEEAAERGDDGVRLFESAWIRGRSDLAARMRNSTVDSGYAEFRWLVAGLSERGMLDELVAFSRYVFMLPSWTATRNDRCEAVRLAFAYDRANVLNFLVYERWPAPIQTVPWCTDAATALKAIEAFGDFSALAWARKHGATKSLAWYEVNR